jgi:hypothetical protein
MRQRARRGSMMSDHFGRDGSAIHLDQIEKHMGGRLEVPGRKSKAAVL